MNNNINIDVNNNSKKFEEEKKQQAQKSIDVLKD